MGEAKPGSCTAPPGAASDGGRSRDPDLQQDGFILVAKVEKHPDVAKTLLESLEDGEDAASAIAEIIEGAGRRLAVALANVEGKAAA